MFYHYHFKVSIYSIWVLDVIYAWEISNKAACNLCIARRERDTHTETDLYLYFVLFRDRNIKLNKFQHKRRRLVLSRLVLSRSFKQTTMPSTKNNFQKSNQNYENRMKSGAKIIAIKVSISTAHRSTSCY